MATYSFGTNAKLFCPLYNVMTYPNMFHKEQYTIIILVLNCTNEINMKPKPATVQSDYVMKVTFQVQAPLANKVTVKATQQRPVS